MVPVYGRVTADLTAYQPGLSLFHCHILQHMDFGLKALFRYAQDGAFTAFLSLSRSRFPDLVLPSQSFVLGGHTMTALFFFRGRSRFRIIIAPY